MRRVLSDGAGPICRNHRVPVGNHRAPVGNHRVPAANHRVLTVNRGVLTGNRRVPTGNRGPPSGRKAVEKGNSRPAFPALRSAPRDGGPIFSHPRTAILTSERKRNSICRKQRDSNCGND